MGKIKMFSGTNISNKVIYLDHNATTNMHSEVKNSLIHKLSLPMNSSSAHQFGKIGYDLINSARKKILNLVTNDDSSGEYELIFTSSGTEANNLIIRNFLEDNIFISSIEHPSILKFALENKSVSVIDVSMDGYLNLDELETKLKLSMPFQNKKKLVSVMFANNITGVVQKYFQEISYLAKKYGAMLHSDITQCLGKIELDISKMGIDFATISAHKFGGMLGAGGLIKKKQYPIKPFLIGGEQENNMRSGTENVFAISSFGDIAQITKNNVQKWNRKLQNLRDYMEEELLKNNKNVEFVHKNSLRLPNTSLIVCRGKKSEIQVMELDLNGIAVSSGSACFSKKRYDEILLQSQSFMKYDIGSSIRVSLGTDNDKKQVQKFIEIYTKINKNVYNAS